MSSLDDPADADYAVRKRRIAFRALAGLLVLVVAWLAFKPATGADEGLPWDKANHALAFMVLTAVTLQGWRWLGFWSLALVMLAAGVTIELVQGLPVVGRDADVWDVVADMTGFALGWTATVGLRRFGRRGAFRG